MKGARLEVSDPAGRTRIVMIEDDRFTIGRSHGNSLSLGSAEISRVHAEIITKGDSYILRDLGSRAGTFVNDETVVESTLGHGDRIRIGRHSELRFLLEEDTETSTRATTSAVGDLRQTATLLEGLRALGTAKVLDQVLAMVIDYAITLSGAERGFIMLVNPAGALEFTLGRGPRQTTLSGDTFQTSRKIPEEVFATAEPQLVADLHDEMFAQAHEHTMSLGIRTVYCVPLKLVRYVEHAVDAEDARSIGVLYLDSREKGSLSSRAIQLGLETLAAEAAVAIENARLYRESQEKVRLERELHTAYEFQQGLLPTAPPAHDYFSAAAEMVPCLSIGGDFFDYLDLDGSFGFVLGDVAGKGAAAGLLGARVQEIFAMRAPGADPAPTLAGTSSPRNTRWYQTGIRFHTAACTPTPVAKSSTASTVRPRGTARGAAVATVIPAASDAATLRATPRSSGTTAVIGSPPSNAPNSSGQKTLIPAEPTSQRTVQTA